MTDELDRLKSALADRYAIEREVGSGGMATVYLAEDLKHHRPVAIKVLRPDLAATLGPERFLREIEVAAQLQHPHILPLHDSGEADGFLYYVMPYVEGQSLRDKLAKEGELPIGEAVRILRDVVDALTEAHANGVVHRDIKPENILLRGRHALVTDFGVAKAVSEATGRAKLTTAGIALGTPAYMAPEQAAADPLLDHRVDVYAVGAVAYEILTGRPVFMGTTPQQILSAHVTEAPQPVTKHRDTVPAALESVVLRCLEKKPADRFQSVEELLPQLEALTTPSGGMTPTETRPVDGFSSRPRRGRVLGAVAAVVAAAALGSWWLIADRDSASAGTSDGRIPVAVLVFEGRASGEEAESFSEGLADDIGAQLSKIQQFSVKAHASARRLSPDTMSYTDIADRLSVDYLVHGNWNRAGDDVRIMARLIDPTNEEQRWAQSFTLQWSASDLFGVQAEVARQVAGALDLELSPAEETRLAAQPTTNIEAQSAYQTGKYFWNRRTGPDLQQAAMNFERAVALDPEYALAYAGLAETYALFSPYHVMPAVDAFPRARHAALRALELDSTLGQAHLVLAWTNLTFDWDWDAAERGFQRALELKPDYATTHFWYSYLFRLSGRHDQALAVMRRAQELDPLSPIIATRTADVLIRAGEFERAAGECRRALRMAPDYPPALTTLGTTLVQDGQIEKGLAQLRAAVALTDSVPYQLSALAWAHAYAGNHGEALELVDNMRERAYVSPASVAEIYAMLGNVDEAMTWLERAFDQREFDLLYIRTNSSYDSLRGDSRFEELLQRMNLPEVNR